MHIFKFNVLCCTSKRLNIIRIISFDLLAIPLQVRAEVMTS